jgi:hypothetical protein
MAKKMAPSRIPRPPLAHGWPCRAPMIQARPRGVHPATKASTPRLQIHGQPLRCTDQMGQAARASPLPRLRDEGPVTAQEAVPGRHQLRQHSLGAVGVSLAIRPQGMPHHPQLGPVTLGEPGGLVNGVDHPVRTTCAMPKAWGTMTSDTRSPIFWIAPWLRDMPHTEAHRSCPATGLNNASQLTHATHPPGTVATARVRWDSGVAPLATGTGMGNKRDRCGRFQQHRRWARITGFPARLTSVSGVHPSVALGRGVSVDSGRLAWEGSWRRRVARASKRLRSVRTKNRTRSGVRCQSSAGMSRPAGRGAGSSRVLPMQFSSARVSPSGPQNG